MYRLTKTGVKRLSDNADIPKDEGNKDWEQYQSWLDGDGNEPEPIEKNQKPSVPTNDEIYDQTIQNNKLIKALALSLNAAGAFSAAGDVLSNAELKALIKSKM